MNDCTLVWRATCPVLITPALHSMIGRCLLPWIKAKLSVSSPVTAQPEWGCLAELQWTFVLPERQRQGIGTQLLSLLQAWFRSHQATRVIVDAAPNNP